MIPMPDNRLHSLRSWELSEEPTEEHGFSLMNAILFQHIFRGKYRGRYPLDINFFTIRRNRINGQINGIIFWNNPGYIARRIQRDFRYELPIHRRIQIRGDTDALDVHGLATAVPTECDMAVGDEVDEIGRFPFNAGLWVAHEKAGAPSCVRLTAIGVGQLNEGDTLAYLRNCGICGLCGCRRSGLRRTL